MRAASRRRVHRFLAILLAFPLALIAGVGPSVAAPPASPAAQGMPGRHLEVMSRNLYLGADLTPLVRATTPDAVNAAVQQILGQVVASEPAKRMAWVANEIAAQRPDLVGLQEAALWQIQTPAGPVTYDFVQLILDALAAKGLNYRVAVDQTNFDSGVQLAGARLPARFADRDVVLVNADRGVEALRVLDTGAAHFTSQLIFPTLLGDVDFARGYVFVDVKSWGKTWRFVNTHFEAYPGFGTVPHDYTSDQARELLTVLPAGLPTVIAGDLNSSRANPLLQGAAVLVDEGGFVDAWTQVHPGEPGYTCCRNAQLSGGELTQRIDYVMTRGDVSATSASVIGVEPLSGTSPRWPSDHAGVVAGVAVGPQPQGVGKGLLAGSRS
jgi:endonuclease/exonuclease/phosphatase family metal-dependent hydrolase